jgi:hypothetical protein
LRFGLIPQGFVCGFLGPQEKLLKYSIVDFLLESGYMFFTHQLSPDEFALIMMGISFILSKKNSSGA